MKLYKYQQIIYDNIQEYFKSNKRVAVIMATGTGKSFIILKWLEDHIGKRILVCSSSTYIFDQLKRYTDNDEALFYRVECLTYAKIYQMTEAELTNCRFDYIVLDEFHRAGATRWGYGIEKLLEFYPNAFVLGTTATHIRHLDNERNMAKELFDNNIAYELNFEEAVIKGILPKFDYITALYASESEIDTLNKKIDNCKKDFLRHTLENELSELKRHIENAYGLKEIFAKYVGHKIDCKFVVFCRNIDHLRLIDKVINSWFEKVNDNIAKYIVLSISSNADSQLRDFINDNRKTHIKLLLAIDKVNEGIHVGDIDGVIMLRSTESNIVYRQQMGRAFSTSFNGENRPMIFDLVNNFENPFIKFIDDGFRIEYDKWNLNKKDYDKLNIDERFFNIYDETIEIKKLFTHINQMVSLPWLYWKKLINDYYEEHGNIKIPKNYVIHGSWLGNYLFYLRKNKEYLLDNKYITQADVEWMINLGFVWNPAQKLWEEFVLYASSYYEREGNLNVPRRYKENGYALGMKIYYMRQTMKDGVLNVDNAYFSDPYKLQWLQEHGMYWNYEDHAWDEFVNAIESYYEREGNLKMKTRHIENGYNLGNKLNKIRGSYKKGTLKLTKEQIKYLDSKGMVWNIKK